MFQRKEVWVLNANVVKAKHFQGIDFDLSIILLQRMPGFLEGLFIHSSNDVIQISA